MKKVNFYMQFLKTNIIIAISLSFFASLMLLASFKLGILMFVSSFFLLFVFILSKFFKDKDAFLWLIFLYPLLPFHMGYDLLPGVVPVFRVHRIFTAFMLLFWLVKSKTVKESIKSFPLTRLFLLTLIPMVISCFFSVFPLFSLFYVGSWGIEYLLFSIMFFDLLREEKLRARIIFIIAISTLLAAIIGLVEYSRGVNFYSLIKPFRLGMTYAITQQVRESAFRIRGAFDHSISFGIFLTLGLTTLLYLLFLSKGIFKKIFYNSSVLIVILAIFLTRSRIAIVLFCIFIIIILGLKRRKTLLSLLMVLSIFLIQPYFFQNLKEKLLFTIQSSFMFWKIGTTEMIHSSMARVDQSKVLMKLIMERPLTGYGRVYLGLQHVDNFYLQFASYFGIISLLTFIFLISVIFKNSIVLYIKGSKEKTQFFGAIMIGVLMGMLCIWTVVALESYFYLLWIFIAIFSRLYVDRKY